MRFSSGEVLKLTTEAYFSELHHIFSESYSNKYENHKKFRKIYFVSCHPLSVETILQNVTPSSSMTRTIRL